MDMSVAIFAVAYGLQLAFTAWAFVETRLFLREHASISGPDALEAFKRVARHNMYLAIAFLPIGITGIASSLAIVARHGGFGLLIVTLTNLAFLIFAVLSKRLTNRARSLSASSPELHDEHHRLGQIWLKKLFPTF